jgi:hypothetical protein
MALEYKYFVVNFIAKASLIIIAVLRVLVVVLHSIG